MTTTASFVRRPLASLLGGRRSRTADGSLPEIKAWTWAEQKSPHPSGGTPRKWLAARSKTVGSSDISAAMRDGDMYDTPQSLWHRKSSGEARPVNNAMLAGTHMQPLIERLALEQIRKSYPAAERIPGGETTHEALNMAGMTCTPDMLVATHAYADGDKLTPRGLIVECKFVADMRSFLAATPRALRQIQHQLAVLDNIYGCTDYEDETAWADRASHGGFDWAATVAVFALRDDDMLTSPETPVLLSPRWIRPDRAIIAEQEAAGAAMLTCLRECVPPHHPAAPAYYSAAGGEK